MIKIQEESIFIALNEIDTLHLKRIYQNPNGPPVFMIHGSIENGKVFYSSSGKGFAPYLAKQGYDVFVADLRGRGKSTPAITKNSKSGLTEVLSEELPAFLDKIKEIKGDVPQYWVGHSWGGVMLLAYFARNQESKVNAMAFFGSKRRISIFSWKKLVMVNFFWVLVAKTSILIKGYLPAKALKMGSDEETAKSHKQTDQWVQSKKWIDWDDRLDYAAKLKSLQLPPVLYLTGKKDDVLGNAIDVRLLMSETGEHQPSKFIHLSKENGSLQDYGHIDILTHKDAEKDHFPIVLDWFRENGTDQESTEH